MSKYGNKETIVDGIKFDSKREASRYQELKLLEKGKQIVGLELQPKYTLQLAFTDYDGVKHQAITYIADFTYFDKKFDIQVVEDCKGMRTEVYKIKKKLFLYGHGGLKFIET
jgi:hypothetical protein